MNLANKGKRTFVSLVLTILITSMIPIMTPTKIDAQPTPVMMILPVQNTYYANTTSPGFKFNVTTRLENATLVSTWQLQIVYDSTVLNCTNMVIPATSIFNLDIDVLPLFEIGAASIGSTELTATGVNGSDVLCTVEFEILGVGTSHINYSRPLGDFTYLLDPLGHDIRSVTLEDASFQYIDNLSVSLSPPGETLVNFADTVLYTATPSNGAQPYTYQWFFKYPNNTEIEVVSAFNSSMWTTDPIRISGPHIVTVQVTDLANAVANASATVRIRTLTVTISPIDKIIDVLDSLTFTATVNGGVPQYRIQWYRNGTVQPSVENLTSATFTFNTVGNEVINVTATDAGGTTAFKTSTVLVLPPHLSFLEVDPAGGATIIYTNMTQELLVNITAITVTDLWTWQINLTWDPAVLSFQDISLPSDHALSEAEQQPGNILIPVGPVLGTGNMAYGVTMSGAQYTFNGTGVLAQVRFRIIRFPESTPVTSSIGFLNKYSDTYMLTYLGNTIPMHSEESMTFNYVLAPRVTHSVAAFGGGTFETFSNASILANSMTGVAGIGNEWSITFPTYGNAGTGGFVNVTIPKALLRGPWLQILVNGTNIIGTAIMTEDATNTYWYFTFAFSSTITLKVVGTIPEPMPMLLIALIMGSLIAVALAKQLPRRKPIL